MGGPGPIAEALITNIVNPLPLRGEVTIRLHGTDDPKPIEVNGFAKPYVPSIYSQDFFVTSRGGEYFFVPSIDMVKQLAN